MNNFEVYINNHPGLSETTKKLRLRALNRHGTKIYCDPGDIFAYLKDTVGLKANTIKSTMRIFSSYLDWMVERGERTENRIKPWMRKHRKLFAKEWQDFQERLEGLPSMEEAIRRVEAITDEEVRKKALQLLHTGMRWSESFTIEQIDESTGRIVGKGGKVRKVFGPWARPIPFTRDRSNFARCLRKQADLGIHDLRRIKASHIAEISDGNIFLLREIFGWSSVVTAQQYIKTDESELRKVMEA